MDAPRKSMIGSQLQDVVSACISGWHVLRHRGPSRIQFWFIALVIGIAAGTAAVLFRTGISFLQQTFYSTDDVRNIQSFAETLPWFIILAIPIFGGMAIEILTMLVVPVLYCMVKEFRLDRKTRN